MASPGQLLDLRNVSVLDVIGLFGGLWVLGEIRPSSGATTWQPHAMPRPVPPADALLPLAPGRCTPSSSA